MGHTRASMQHLKDTQRGVKIRSAKPSVTGAGYQPAQKDMSNQEYRVQADTECVAKGPHRYMGKILSSR